MFGKFFKKEKAERDINQLIFDVAEYQREKDYEELCKFVTQIKLYTSVDAEFLKNIPQGEEYITKLEESIKVSHVELKGLKYLLFFTSQTDKRLGENYFEISGIEALKMILKLEEISGLLIQNKNDSWAGFDKERIKSILSNL